MDNSAHKTDILIREQGLTHTYNCTQGLAKNISSYVSLESIVTANNDKLSAVCKGDIEITTTVTNRKP